MKKSKGRGGSHTKSNRNRKQAPKRSNDEKQARDLSYNVLEVTPALWANIASFASRQSMSRLCTVSHDFYSVFSAILYADTIDPPLNAAQSSKLIRTLSDAQATGWKLHPAILICQLGLRDDKKTRNAETRASAVDALNNLYALTLGERTRGSALRVLEWDLEAGLDELGKILGALGNFPNLKELNVSSNGTNNNFNFVQIGGLEVLKLNCCIDCQLESGQIGDKLCYKLAQAIEMLPTSSPRLHTLKLKLRIAFDHEFPDFPFPSMAYSDLVGALTRIHLPELVTFDFSASQDLPVVEDEDEGNRLPQADFSAFLASHPNLLDLTLNAPVTEFTEDISFLPRLRSFKGSFEHSATICSPKRQLDKLTIIFIHPWLSFDPPSFAIQAIRLHSSLTKLHVLAVDTSASENIVKLTDELSPETFADLSTSFPNLTHLDVCISERIIEYCEGLMLLTKLQSLRVQEYRTTPVRPSKRAVTKIFPPSDYIPEFRLLLPFLPQLASIEICLLADTRLDEEDSDFENDWDYMWDPPEMRVDYRFSVTRKAKGADVVLTHTQIYDGCVI
ncbi:hypothetical protein C8R44DRAFT_135006 [Mycena epipterygia]|nr:hypothetical protein C8R44DRAFT_135006 [Mycena epipterygia]